MDYVIENESNTTNSSLYNFTRDRIVITATSGTAVLVAALILILLLYVKAYRSILQRLFMWFVLIYLVGNACRVASVLHEFYRGNTVVIHILDKQACQYLAFLSVWIVWCSHTIIIAVILYLVILVLTTTRNCPACVVKIRNSKRLRVFLEVCTIFGVLLSPLLVLWIPFYDTWYTYGFNDFLCGMEVTNSENKSATDLTLAAFYYGEALIQLTGLAALLGATIVLLNYCISPAIYKLQHIKKLTRNIILFFLTVTLCVAAYDMIFIKSKGQILPLILVAEHLVKLTLLIIYLIAFHFS